MKNPYPMSLRGSTLPTKKPTMGIIAIIIRPAGDSTFPDSSAVYPSSVCVNCGIRIVVPYSANPSTNISVKLIAKLRRLNSVRFKIGRCPTRICRSSHQIITTNATTHATAKNVMMCAFGAHYDIKQVVVVDKDVDISSSEEIEWAVRCGIECGADIIKVGYTGDVLGALLG